jgi:hypothetical protein
MDFTVFYAWQSDRPENTNRFLVRDAAKAAIKRLVKDSDVEESPRLDHDTKDVPRLAEVAGTIFRKIEGCGLFLADLTFVGTSERREGKESRLLPNSNVVLELGYAARSVGWERVIAVMNTIYGPPSQMIFDVLHRRWPITFDMKEGEAARIAEVRATLSSRIETWIRGAMKAEHAAAEEAIKSLDVDCMNILHEAGGTEYFSEPTNLDGRFLHLYHMRKLATLRLLDLRLLEARHDPTQNLYAYHWTHLGKLVLSKLGIRRAESGAEQLSSLSGGEPSL